MTFIEPSASGQGQAAFYWEGLGSYLTLNLSMYIESLSCSPSYEEIDNTLQDITSVLETYAKVQGNITEWDNSHSHVLNGNVFADKWWAHENEVYGTGSKIRVVNWVISVILTVVFLLVFKRCTKNIGYTK